MANTKQMAAFTPLVPTFSLPYFLRIPSQRNTIYSLPVFMLACPYSFSITCITCTISFLSPAYFLPCHSGILFYWNICNTLCSHPYSALPLKRSQPILPACHFLYIVASSLYHFKVCTLLLHLILACTNPTCFTALSISHFHFVTSCFKPFPILTVMFSMSPIKLFKS